MRDRCCATCRFFAPDHTPVVGRCLRNAPRPLHISKQVTNVDFVWPWVEGQDWCGEHKYPSPLAQLVVNMLGAMGVLR